VTQARLLQPASGQIAQLAYIAIGSNLEGPVEQVRRALAALAALPAGAGLRPSSLYRSPPWDGSAQPDYINAVAVLAWHGEADDLFDQLRRLEQQAGRQREGLQRNQPRTLDLDLLLFGAEIRNDPQLCLPHPRMLERAFVMCPLAELAPQLRMADGRSAAEHAERLREAPLHRIDLQLP
jgi:2-amino-4-hydroxy-6-hydroxymethyldihydropteridine diphosphokinase